MPYLTTIAEFEALTGEDALTPAEHQMIKACREGRLCILDDGTLPAPGTKDRQIRANLLRLLITGGSTACALHPMGVMLQGAEITATLDLSFLKGRGRCALDACRFAAAPMFARAILAQLSLQGSHLPGLFAQGITVEGNVFLKNLTATGTVDLAGADIGGQLSCTGARFDGAGGKALNAQGAKVGQSLFLRTLTATGTVDLTGADIGGQLDCAGARFDGAGGNALNAQGAKVGQDLFLRTLSATGTVDVNGADIGGQLSCAGARFDGAGGNALNAQGAKVGQSLFLSTLKATGTVDLNGADIGGQLDCTGATLDGAGKAALYGQRLHVTEGFFFRDLTSVKGAVNLTAAHVGDLVDDSGSWPIGRDEVIIDGFSYDRIMGTAPQTFAARKDWLSRGCRYGGTFYPQPYTQFAKVLRRTGHEREAREVMIAAANEKGAADCALLTERRRLSRDLRRPSKRPSLKSLERLESRFESLPGALSYEATAALERFHLFHRPRPVADGTPPALSPLTMAYACQDFRNQMWVIAAKCRARGLWIWARNRFLKGVIGYGHKPANSLIVLFALFLVATTLAHFTWEEGSFAPNSDVILTSSGWLAAEAADCVPTPAPNCDPNPAATWSNDPARGLDWDSFNRYGYAADLVVPILNLGQTEAWAPSRDRGPLGWWLWWGRWVLAAAGWIVSALGVAAITGIMQRNAPE